METLKQDLESAQQSSTQLREISKASEEALVEITQTYDEYKAATDQEIKELQVAEFIKIYL
jgi:hypothetical protein